MIQNHDLLYLIPLVFVCILLVTKAYKKDYSLSIVIVSFSVASLIFSHNKKIAVLIYVLSILVLLLRAIANHKFDDWIKK